MALLPVPGEGTTTASSPSGPPEGKASGFNATVRALHSMLPPSAFERVVRSLPPETAEIGRQVVHRN